MVVVVWEGLGVARRKIYSCMHGGSVMAPASCGWWPARAGGRRTYRNCWNWGIARMVQDLDRILDLDMRMLLGGRS
jgi:hypothetical protein